MNRDEAIEVIKVLKAIINFSDVSKMLSTFISAFEENSVKNPDGHYYLYGNFNLGGTVSGRLSSSDPNLQNIPANSIYSKHIKKCFTAAPNRIMAGADFLSLEDRISALLTKDTNKLKVYMGHNIYELTVNGITHHIRDDAIIEYDGKTYTGEEFYAYSISCQP